MANNILIYNAAIAGIVGGARSRKAALNLPAILSAASTIDAAIPTDSAINTNGHARIVRSICYGLFSRYSYVNLDSRIIQRVSQLLTALADDVLPEAAIEGSAPDGEFRVSDIPDGYEVGNTISWDGGAWVPSYNVGVNKVTGTGGDAAHIKLSNHLQVNLNNSDFAFEPIDSVSSQLNGGMAQPQEIRIRNGANGGYFGIGRNGLVVGVKRMHWMFDAHHNMPNWSKSYIMANEETGPTTYINKAYIRMDAIGARFLFRGVKPGGSAIPGEPDCPEHIDAGMTQSQVINLLVNWHKSMFGWRTS